MNKITPEAFLRIARDRKLATRAEAIPDLIRTPKGGLVRT